MVLLSNSTFKLLSALEMQENDNSSFKLLKICYVENMFKPAEYSMSIWAPHSCVLNKGALCWLTTIITVCMMRLVG